MTVKPGEIVWAAVLDPEGKPCDEPHPVMVLRAHAGVQDAWVVGISTKFTEPPPRHWLRLPYAEGGHSITGLTRACVLKCNWVQMFPIRQLSEPMGIVPPELYDLAVDLILAEVRRRKTLHDKRQ